MAEIYKHELLNRKVAINVESITKKTYAYYVGKHEMYWYGRVERIFDNSDGLSYGVRINGHENGCSTGLFYFTIDQLIVDNSNEYFNLTEKGDLNNMKDLVLGEYKIARVLFAGNPNPVNYRIYDDGTEYEAGDSVVCKTKNHGLAIATIKEIVDHNDNNGADTEREIVCCINMAHYNYRQAKVKEAIRLKKKMDEKVRQLQGLALYELLSKESPELKEMVASYKSLVGVE